MQTLTFGFDGIANHQKAMSLMPNSGELLLQRETFHEQRDINARDIAAWKQVAKDAGIEVK